MDKKIEKKTWTLTRISYIIAGVVLLVLFIYALVFMDVQSTLNVEKQKISISTVQSEVFQEFIQVTGVVQPIQTIYLDAIEGGVIQHVYRESGDMVQEGDTLLTLANSGLQLQVMQQTSGLYDQINNVRNSRLNLEQNTLTLQDQLANAKSQMNILEARFERQKKLIDNNLISKEEFQVTKSNYLYQKKRYELTEESFQKDSLQSLEQLKQLNNSEDRMYKSLNIVQQILDNLIVVAPISGQLSTIELNQGQSISSGERIGQIDILDSYKVRVSVDEYHLYRIIPGLSGSFSFGGQNYNLAITKIYPVISNGQFEVDMEFTGNVPEGLRRGQTLRIRLEMGESEYAVQIPRGGFYQSTGGNWVFVLNEDGDQAFKREIQIGRQNPENFEIISGLEQGEMVITSSYDTFGENEVLILE